MEKITKGNTLIAKFVGIVIDYYQTNHPLDPPEYDMEIKSWPSFLNHDEDLMHLYEVDIPYEHLMFHLDWNWLMGVVDMIEKTTQPYRSEFEDEGWQGTPTVTIWTNKDGCSIECKTSGADFWVSIQKKNKKEAVWEAVVQFIEWYNKEKLNGKKGSNGWKISGESK